MEEKKDLINIKLKNSFEKVKSDINLVKNELLTLKEQLIKEIEKNKALNKQLSKILEENQKKEPNNKDLKKSSNGNEGVIHSFIHSFTSYAHNKSFKIKEFKDEIDKMFANLPRQEFLVFLMIYQLEDDLKRPITYLELANHLKLSEGCIRTYISNLLKKNLPIIKHKINNKLIELSINPHFRDLNLKQKVTNLFYLSDIGQKRLLDTIN